MQTEHETITSDQKLKLWLAVLCQIVSFFAVLLLFSWGFSRI
jgi:hypothetical protein